MGLLRQHFACGHINTSQVGDCSDIWTLNETEEYFDTTKCELCSISYRRGQNIVGTHNKPADKSSDSNMETITSNNISRSEQMSFISPKIDAVMNEEQSLHVRFVEPIPKLQESRDNEQWPFIDSGHEVARNGERVQRARYAAETCKIFLAMSEDEQLALLDVEGNDKEDRHVSFADPQKVSNYRTSGSNDSQMSADTSDGDGQKAHVATERWNKFLSMRQSEQLARVGSNLVEGIDKEGRRVRFTGPRWKKFLSKKSQGYLA